MGKRSRQATEKYRVPSMAKEISELKGRNTILLKKNKQLTGTIEKLEELVKVLEELVKELEVGKINKEEGDN